MATVITQPARNTLAINGINLPKFWIVSLKDNRFPENGIIPAELVCWRAGSHVTINVPDLLDTTPAFVYSFSAIADVFIDIADNKLRDEKNPRIKIATSSGQGTPIKLYPGNRIRIDNDGSVFVIQRITNQIGNEIEYAIDKIATNDDITKILNDSSILQLWNKDADIIAHINKIHALTT